MPLSDRHLSLLEELFAELSNQPDGVNAARFRAKREDLLADIDSLERGGLIERKDNIYLPRLEALAELKKTNSRADSLLYLCSHLFQALRALYIENPETPITVTALAQAAEQPEPMVRRALRYLIQAPIWGGYSTDFSVADAYVVPGESILRYKTFDDCINQLRQWAIRKGAVSGQPIFDAAFTQPSDLVQESRLDSIERQLLGEVKGGRRSFAPSSQAPEDLNAFQLIAKTLDHLAKKELIQPCKVKHESQSGKRLAVTVATGDLTFEGERYLANWDKQSVSSNSSAPRPMLVGSTAQRKYQVFISSTFKDLQAERQAAVEGILLAGHIPAGMELFSAGNESQLQVIRQWIHESDIFMLILGNRYGSIEPRSQLSYTELEYDHAMNLGKPLFALVLSDAAIEAKLEADRESNVEEANAEKHAAFKEKVLSKISGLVHDAKDIKIHTMKSIQSIAAKYQLSGWVRVIKESGAS